MCGCTNEKACVTAAGPCYWVESNLCSVCAELVPGGVLRGSDMEALFNAEPVVFNLPLPHAFMLLSLIQVALRHPDVSLQEFVAQFGEVFGRQLQEKLSLTPNLSAVCEAGWPKPCPEQNETPIILPPGYGQ